uniref:Sushi domain-containing protein n=1 Tax=Gopherus evgoodei TaxID=1825980 RepID=A0A8C4VQE0_9SAUR
DRLPLRKYSTEHQEFPCILTFSLPCLSLLLCICDSPPRLSFAELPGVVNNSYPVGTELKYSCRPGYILVPGRSPVVTCLANSTWSCRDGFVKIPVKSDIAVCLANLE